MNRHIFLQKGGCMSKPTPGPWVVDTESPPRVLACDSRQTIVAVVQGARSNPGAMADARLIAAAPDLLHALKELLAVLHEGDPVWQAADAHCKLARAVIAKAEGR